jgi:hypothetical protein
VLGASPLPAAAAANNGSATAAQLAAALERVQQLERQNGELRDAASKKDAVLAESRRFIESYLQRSAAAAEQRQKAARSEGGPAPPGASGAAARSPNGAPQPRSRGPTRG